MAKVLSRLAKIVYLAVVVGLIVIGFAKRQTITDYIGMLGYSPPATVSAIARDDTMSAEATHLFYLNQPQIADKASFRADCPSDSEQTIVLGCYKSNQGGIFLLSVSDPKLSGVEQVTAAHEMLHAAYDRLSSAERSKVDSWLRNYYKTVTNEQIIATIDAYRRSEPGNVENEMHSVFGTEISKLPVNLENYYKRYFINRSRVTSYATRYRATFNDLKLQISRYDAKLARMKQSIDANEARINSISRDLAQKRADMNALRGSHNINGYNALVPSFNAEANEFNQLIADTKIAISNYNAEVAKRNDLAISVNNLSNELDADVGESIPTN
jgi:hypothetical protein